MLTGAGDPARCRSGFSGLKGQCTNQRIRQGHICHNFLNLVCRSLHLSPYCGGIRNIYPRGSLQNYMLVRLERFERSTHRLKVCYSSQLSYRRIFVLYVFTSVKRTDKPLRFLRLWHFQTTHNTPDSDTLVHGEYKFIQPILAYSFDLLCYILAVEWYSV